MQIDTHIDDTIGNDIIDVVIANAIPRLATQHSNAAVTKNRL